MELFGKPIQIEEKKIIILEVNQYFVYLKWFKALVAHNKKIQLTQVDVYSDLHLWFAMLHTSMFVKVL